MPAPRTPLASASSLLTLCRCGRRVTVPTEARVLTPATCEYGIFQEQGAAGV